MLGSAAERQCQAQTFQRWAPLRIHQMLVSLLLFMPLLFAFFVLFGFCNRGSQSVAQVGFDFTM